MMVMMTTETEARKQSTRSKHVPRVYQTTHAAAMDEPRALAVVGYCMVELVFWQGGSPAGIQLLLSC